MEDLGGWVSTFPSPLQWTKRWNFDLCISLLRRALRSTWLLQIWTIFLPLSFSKKGLLCFTHLTPGKRTCFGDHLETVMFFSPLAVSGLGTEKISWQTNRQTTSVGPDPCVSLECITLPESNGSFHPISNYLERVSSSAATFPFLLWGWNLVPIWSELMTKIIAGFMLPARKA